MNFSTGSGIVDSTASFVETIDLLADVSGDLIMDHFQTPVDVELKEDHSPVTVADRGAEEAMRRVIMHRHPAHGIFGEECGMENEDAEFRWVLDPIDGTKSFISGVPLFGTLIALCRNGQPLFGCANFPALGLRYFGDGTRTTINGSETRMRETASIEDATVLVTDHTHVWKHKNGEAFDALAVRARIFRSWGDCYGYALLAGGHADVMIDPILQPWDMLALIPIIRGAGGSISSYEGGDPLGSNSLVAASPALHAAVIDALQHP
jgi:histidinol phosphatase-like enzyme (inositol monophosphatase family)